MSRNTLISIIVPVYNCEKFIGRCIDSILAQTFTDFELLIIDDGSTDCSGTICDKFSKKDKRIRVIHQPNQGVSTARNIGIELSSGEYITFIDADDYILPNYIDSFDIKSSSDFIIQGITLTYNNKSSLHLGFDVTKLCSFEEVFAESFSNSLIFGPWCKLYKREIIQLNGLRFNSEIKYGEDRIFVLQYLSNCMSFKKVCAKSYVYTHENPICLTQKDHSWEKLYIYILAFYETTMHLTKLRSIDNSTKALVLKDISYDFIRALISLIKCSNYNNADKITKLKSINCNLSNYIQTCKILPIRFKLIQLLYKYFPPRLFLYTARLLLKI